jgi:HSP20 family protein
MPTVKEQPKQQQQQPAQTGGPPAPARSETLAPYRRDSFSLFREEMNRLFDRFFGGWPAPWVGGRWDGWGMDVIEDEGAVTVRAEAPGFEPGDFDIQVRGDRLILRAARKAESEREGGYREWHRQEFYRSVALPAGTDPDKVDAQYRNGVLTVRVPITEQGRSRRIQVKG